MSNILLNNFGRICFLNKNKIRTLKNGNKYINKKDFCYNELELEYLNQIKNLISSGKNWKKVIEKELKEKNPWLCDIVLNNKRTKFLKFLDIGSKDIILDIGAGWGQFTIPIAKKNKVCAIDSNVNKIEIISKIANQEKIDENIFFMGCDYLDTIFFTKFNFVLCIGVLEWVGVFKKNVDPHNAQMSFLKKIRNNLKKNGKLVIGIENRIGLKYLMGSEDDHTGEKNISYFNFKKSRLIYKRKFNKELNSITYSFHEYKDMLIQSGFNDINFYAALPDYKIPKEIIPINDNGTMVNDFFIRNNFIEEHNGCNGQILPHQNYLFDSYMKLAKENVAHLFVPSFYIVAS